MIAPDNKTVKLTDFGTSKYVKGCGYTTTIIGSKYFMAPQIGLRNDPVEYDPKAADVFSLGCLLHIALTGKPPFNGENELQVTTKMLTNEIAEITYFEE